MALYGKHIDYRLDTKSMAGINFTAKRRPYRKESNSKNLAPAWMLSHHTLDLLTWTNKTKLHEIKDRMWKEHSS